MTTVTAPRIMSHPPILPDGMSIISGETRLERTQNTASEKVMDISDLENTQPDPAIVRSYLWKTDWRLLPALSLVYLLAVMDRANIGNAMIAGLTTDLNLKGDDINLAISLFFVSYIIFEIPSNLMMKKSRPSRWLPTLILIWSASCIGMAFCKNLNQLIVARLFLGAAEAGFTPGVVYYMTFWYTKAEQGPRMSLFFATGTLSGVFGGPIAAGLSTINGGGLNSWQWIFLIEGCISAFLAIVAYFYVQDFPETARFLTEAEKSVELARLGAEKAIASTAKLSKRQIYDALIDWKCYVFAVMFFAINVNASTISVFLPTLINALGYQAFQAQAMSSLPALCGFIGQLLSSPLSKYFARSWLLLSYSFIGVIGFVILIIVEDDAPVLFFALCLASFGVYPNIPLLATYMTNNIGGITKRGVATGMTVMGGGVAGAIGAFCYRTVDAPRFLPGHVINFIMLIVIMLGTILMRIYFVRENARRARMSAKEKEAALAGLTEDEVDDLGDKNPSFVFLY
ncbi:major facilitator superfamily domain-containing protein [Jimgerdemannia flammicorona]|uniref:Major facilitator superfamily domain-containing protein n=1 Tax=Jimgerdemannia flammicorona TaxID=994334 RepID=A0A433QWZ9_9FUNG|nr:major facilitator superfamily domain-containing protein [Jimgerdemannia flammicorona]